VNESIDGVNRKKIESGEGDKNEVQKMKRTKKIKNESNFFSFLK
jgi:hypothetical protein